MKYASGYGSILKNGLVCPTTELRTVNRMGARSPWRFLTSWPNLGCFLWHQSSWPAYSRHISAVLWLQLKVRDLTNCFCFPLQLATLIISAWNPWFWPIPTFTSHLCHLLCSSCCSCSWCLSGLWIIANVVLVVLAWWIVDTQDPCQGWSSNEELTKWGKWFSFDWQWQILFTHYRMGTESIFSSIF